MLKRLGQLQEDRQEVELALLESEKELAQTKQACGVVGGFVWV